MRSQLEEKYSFSIRSGENVFRVQGDGIGGFMIYSPDGQSLPVFSEDSITAAIQEMSGKNKLLIKPPRAKPEGFAYGLDPDQ